jgi:catechol 2,3-dioxygenase-like lactoylglutathione lyase family enzyme
MLKRLSHVCLGSTHLARTIGFYRDLLGCRVVHEFRNDAGELYGVFLSCNNGTFLEFFNEREEKPPGGLYRHLCFEVDSIEATAQKLRAAGLDAEVRRGRTDRILQCFTKDPDGNIVEFQQHDAESVLYPYVSFGLSPSS